WTLNVPSSTTGSGERGPTPIILTVAWPRPTTRSGALAAVTAGKLSRNRRARFPERVPSLGMFALLAGAVDLRTRVAYARGLRVLAFPQTPRLLAFAALQLGLVGPLQDDELDAPVLAPAVLVVLGANWLRLA